MAWLYFLESIHPGVSNFMLAQKAWTQLLGTSGDDLGYSAATASDGSIYITGATSGRLDGKINSGGNDIFLAKYNGDGLKVWTQL